MTQATEFTAPPSRRLGSVESPLSIGDITELIKGSLERQFVDIVISGEVSNFKPHPSGHFYFSLKDERAAISAVMFRGENSKIKFQMHDGLKVIAMGRITVYPPRGNYQIMVQRLEPAGLGALQLAFEQLKKKLDAEGLFDSERKRPIPKFPRKVGIVTAPAGAAIRDMLNILERRFASLPVLIYPVKVQGVGAGDEVAEGIRMLNRCFPEIDVMIVGRGGGSIEDLWAFNEEVVARAIYESKIPVISAVGHEIDFTIADFVADLRAPTPSAAAELVIGSRVEIIQHLDHLVRRLCRLEDRLDYARLRLDEMVQRLGHSLEGKISDFRLNFERLVLILRRSLQAPLQESRHKVERYSERLKLLNPLAIMERGYSIVRRAKTGKVVKRVSDVEMNEKLIIELWKGKISTRVSP